MGPPYILLHICSAHFLLQSLPKQPTSHGGRPAVFLILSIFCFSLRFCSPRNDKDSPRTSLHSAMLSSRIVRQLKSRKGIHEKSMDKVCLIHILHDSLKMPRRVEPQLPSAMPNSIMHEFYYFTGFAVILY